MEFWVVQVYTMPRHLQSDAPIVLLNPFDLPWFGDCEAHSTPPASPSASVRGRSSLFLHGHRFESCLDGFRRGARFQ